MGINLTCPECGQQMRFDLNSTTLQCPSCGYTRGTGLDEKAAEIRAKGPRPSVKITDEDQINARAVSLFYTAHDELFQGDKAAAIHTLQEAIDIQPDFLDAHLWIAKITDDEHLKREHLSSILAYNGGHAEATQMMLVLNGRLTPEQAASASQNNEPALRRVDFPVNIQTAVLRCPNCGGDLTAHEESGQVECRFLWLQRPDAGAQHVRWRFVHRRHAGT